MIRTGFGYDIHPLKKGRKLILGGTEIPFEMGLDGHSDADALCHAICDALLGAAALGDIGEHFPDTDPAYRGASSIGLLQKTGRLLKDAGFRILNLDATIVAEAPKLGPYKREMAGRIAEGLSLPHGQVSVKAKTNEGFGPPGRSEAIAVYAVASVIKNGV